MAPFYEWGSTASRLQPLRGGSLLFTIKSTFVTDYPFFCQWYVTQTIKQVNLLA